MLVSRCHCGDFAHHDAFVAFLGIDVRTKDSGKHKGRRKLTKHGDDILLSQRTGLSPPERRRYHSRNT